MNEQSDVELLSAYAIRHEETAFRELVHRHTDFVYSSALRQVESSAAAADLTQSVFTDLARKSPELLGRFQSGSLSGWLHRATRYAALNHLRSSRRRQENERQAMEQLLTDSAPDANWEQIRPMLDEALDALDDTDREALLLRYFKNQDFRNVGQQLGVSDDTAQKRVSRALERLREFFTKRGVSAGAGGLAVAISANAVQAAPAGLVLTISSAALTGTASAAAAIAATTKTIAMTTLQKTIITATVATLAGAGVYEAHQASQLRGQVLTLQQQQAPLLQDLQQLRAQLEGATNSFAASKEALARLEQDRMELLKLRGETTTLRGQLGSLRNQLGEAKRALTNASQRTAHNELPADAAEQQKHMQMAKLIDGKNYSAQMFMFADNNQGWLPTNWLELSKYAGEYPASGTNDFEFVHKQPLNIRQLGTNFGNTVVVRECLAWPTYDGKWRKVYGFADGHSQVVELPDGNFTAWENANTYNPEAPTK